MGVKKLSKWAVDKDELCLYLSEPDDGCYEVPLSDKTFTSTPVGLGSTLDNVLQIPPDHASFKLPGADTFVEGNTDDNNS